MKWKDFEKSMKSRGVLLFKPSDLERFLGRTKIAARFLIHRLKQKGEILRIKPGLYQFSEVYMPDLYLANKLYEPSYVSLEFALSYHNIIPEVVYEITSVTSKITREFVVQGKVFSFHRIKKEAFTGYVLQKQDEFGFFIAEPEKAFVDWLYLRGSKHVPDLDRLKKTRLNLKKVFHYATLFKKLWLMKFLKTFL